MYFRFCLLCILSFFSLLSFSLQSQSKVLKVSKRLSTIKIDGKLDDAVWKDLDIATDFTQSFPTDTLDAIANTEVKMFYDDNYIYVGAKMYDTNNKNFFVESLKRDFSGRNVDGFHIVFDTYSDYNTAFSFSITPYGSQREGLLSDGGKFPESLDRNWDNKWFSEVYVQKGKYWSAEFKIPFKILRYKYNNKKWRANFYRLNNKDNELTAWNKVPFNNILFNLSFCGDLEFEEDLPKPGKNISIIPYTLGGLEHLKEDGKHETFNYNFGGDAKLALTPSLNLDLTINPDFSQVEVDNQQVNLSRFELFFPEKRQFFIENGDLFASLGTAETQRPFFSRRIGLVTDTTDHLVSAPIYFGMRMTGKFTQNLRVGVLNMQVGSDREKLYPNINYTAAVLQHKVLTSSNITVFLLNKNPLLNNSQDTFLSYNLDQNNKVWGSEFNFASPNGQWGSKTHIHYSLSIDSNTTYDYAIGTSIYNIVPKRNWFLSYSSIGKNYNSEMGFVPRTDISRLGFGGEFVRFIANPKINQQGLGTRGEFLWNTTYGITDIDFNLYHFYRFTNNASFGFGGNYKYTYLYDPFDPSGSEGLELEENTSYHYYGGGFRLSTDQRQKISLFAGGSYGTYFNGTRLSLRPRLTLRFRPYVICNFGLDFNSVRLPKPYSSEDIWLATTNLEITFTRNIFLNSLLQYNTQEENFGINTRFQWRFRPVSDIFVVYTENFYDRLNKFPQTRNRTIILKVVYWL